MATVMLRTDRRPARQSGGTARRTTPPQTLGARLAWAIVIGLFLAFFTLPILWLLLAPTRSDADIIRGNPLAFGSLSDLGATWRHLYDFQSHAIVNWVENSAVYCFTALAIMLPVTITAGYALAMTEFRGRKALLTITLLVMLMPTATLVLPLYLEMNALGLDGSRWSVILPFSFFPFGVYLTYIYYSSTVPGELLAAARIDGANEWQVFRYIALPLARPVVALVAFFSFLHNWNNFFLPFVMLPDSDQYPATVGLSNLLTSSPMFNSSTGISSILRPELALAALLTSIPVLVVFLLSQRALVSGMTAGATKE
ncbi:carbohydrate ABC transporter permease [Dactylosporangium sp. McL0621]|uniref:carbohydrate ABC transporter permease n=1 Tax=Dactylosporangium sp. McL0621 TaxID=3415678 RepID=UPI003CEFE762